MVWDNTLEMIYGAVLEPELWSDVLADVVSKTGARGGTLSIEKASEMAMLAFHQYGYDEASLTEYAEEGFQLDEWTRILMEKDSGCFLSSDLHCFSYSDYLKKPMYGVWGKKMDIHRATGTLIDIGNDKKVRFALQRGRQGHAFDHDDLMQLNQLRPHLQQAVLMSNRLSEDQLLQASSLNVFNDLDRVIIVVGRQGKIEHSNTLAEQKLYDKRFPLSVSQGLLHSSERSIADYLHSAMAQAAQGNQLSLPICFLEQETLVPWEVTMMPVVAALSQLGLNYHVNQAMVIARRISLVKHDHVLIQYLSRRYALTALEADCVIGLKQGKAPQSIAEERRVKISTVRSQIKTVYKKMAVSSQVELLALLLSLE